MTAHLAKINPAVLGAIGGLSRQFAEAKPFRFVVIDDFLSADFADRLLAEFPAFEKGNSVGDDGRRGGKSTVERVKSLGPAYRDLDAMIQAPDFLGFIGAITGVESPLYDPFYLGGGTHENRHGQGLQAHVDFNYHPSERWHRRLNLIVYLNPEWDAAWGGNLELYRDPYQDAAPAHRVTPAMNRCVIFETTERSWHGFDRIKLPADKAGLSRRSVALYFYSKDRPAEQVAAKHTTHYVDAQLPGHMVEGYRLTGEDVALLKDLIAHRDNRARLLYEENSKLLQAQEQGFSGQLLFLLKRLYVRYRR
ncbi:MAG TPA: 2OG-Fe(II) oxygenase [Gammaproteobacteria bacterium]|nr:2OG-Fe(II) oxygenase [Gammaproteobacteria bacterium]